MTIDAAFITGAHPYDVPAVTRGLDSIAGVRWHVQSLDNFAADINGSRDRYDALVFYNFHQPTPTDNGEWWEQNQRTALEAVGTSGPGVVILHHAILAFPDWEHWSTLVGIADRRFSHHPMVEFTVNVDSGHPITDGVSDYSFRDETYVMQSAGPGSQILASTQHPDSMGTLLWVRDLPTRVVCFQSGHGAEAFDSASFRALLQRCTEWAGGLL